MFVKFFLPHIFFDIQSYILAILHLICVVVDAALPRHHNAPYRDIVKLPASSHPILNLYSVRVAVEFEVDVGVGDLGGLLVPSYD